MKTPTTLRTDTDPVQRFLTKNPGAFLAGLHEQTNEIESVFLTHIDQVEFSLKRYLAGDRTQAELFEHIQSFLDLDKEIAAWMVNQSIQFVADTLTQLEAYELLVKFQAIHQELNQAFPLINNIDQ